MEILFGVIGFMLMFWGTYFVIRSVVLMWYAYHDRKAAVERLAMASATMVTYVNLLDDCFSSYPDVSELVELSDTIKEAGRELEDAICEVTGVELEEVLGVNGYHDDGVEWPDVV